MNTLKDWQTVQAAAKQIKCSAAGIYLAITRKEIDVNEQLGRKLVPNPLAWRPDRARQKRAKVSNR